MPSFREEERFFLLGKGRGAPKESKGNHNQEEE
jgi:hypothetical protein